MVSSEIIRPGAPAAFVTKILIPQRRHDVLLRPRLVDFLNRHLDRKLILVCAPAGHGKTTLLADFAHQTDLPVCWYSLGPGDADPRVFLEYLIAAIRRRFPTFGERVLRYLESAGVTDLETPLGLLVGDLHESIDGRLVIVLDDVHVVDGEPAIQKLLDLLIPNLPSNCCCILASRVLPRMSVSRLVANREAAGLGTPDLRFTPAEIKELFSRHYQQFLPDADVERLAQESEGWIAGIILTTHTLWQGLVKGMIEAKRSGGPIFDYLASEVFDHQELRLQRFLLGSSVLSRLSSERCDALLDAADSAEMLSLLDQHNLLVFQLGSEPAQTDWYRYHPLFQDFLQARLRQSDSAAFGRLHRRAGDLAAADGDTDTAIDHYFRGGDPARAADLIERLAEATFNAGRLQTLLRWCDRLPADLLDDRPQIQLQRARAAFETGDLTLAQTALQSARNAGHRLGDRRLLASTMFWHSLSLRSQSRYDEAVDECQAGLAIAEALGDSELTTSGWKQLGLALGAAGSLENAIPALERALAGYVQTGDSYYQGVICHALGIAWKRLGQVSRAGALLDQAAVHWRTIGNSGMLAGTLVVIGNLHYDLGRTEDALQVLAEARRAAEESGHLRLAGYAIETAGNVARDRGDFAAALAAYAESLAIAEKAGDRFLQAMVLDGEGRCRLYSGDAGLARAAILRARQIVAEREAPFDRGICEDAYGLLCLEDGAVDEAVLALDRACGWLEASGAVRELARARLHLARALLGAGEANRAAEAARAALELLPGGAHEPLLTVEGARLADVLRLANPGGPPWLDEVLRRVGTACTPASVVPPAIRCYTLGGIDVELDGRCLAADDWTTQKARDLWFYLLAGGPAPRDRIVEALWPDGTLGSVGAFRMTLHRLRRALFPECVERRGDLYGIPRALVVWTDDHEFEQAAEQTTRFAESGSPEFLAAATRAIELYRGPYLADCYADWCVPRRHRLESLYLRLLRDLIAKARAGSQHDQVIAYAELYLQTDPDNEMVHEALMRSYASLGNRLAALRHYQRYAKHLRAELEVDPSQHLRRIVAQIAGQG